jgi:iron complex outermembrane receptor protein
MKKNTDSLAGMSWDATPLASEIDYLNLHMDYGIDLSEHWRAQFAYDWLKTDMLQEDEYRGTFFTQDYGELIWTDALGLNTFDGEYKNSTYTGELTYKETIGNNRLSGGIKVRYKALDSFTNEGQDALVTSFTEEKIASVFFQDQYALSVQELLTFGISYNNIARNGNVKDDSLLQLRLGYIYSSSFWSYKTYLYRSQFALEPLVRYLNLPIYKNTEPQTTIGVTQELAYSNEKQRIRLFLHYMQDEDSLFQDRVSGLGQETKYFTTIFNYNYNFNVDNKMSLQLYYANYRDIFNLDKLEDISGYFSFTNSYENFDFYNGVVWHRNSLNWKNYYDLTSSVSWNINEDLTLTLKGDNLLNKAKKTRQVTINPANAEVGTLEISPIDQRITIELEYLF